MSTEQFSTTESLDQSNDVKAVFESLKSKKQQMTEIGLQDLHDNAMQLATKCSMTGQIESLKKLIFVIEHFEHEKQLLDLGINTFVYKDDIDFFVDNNPSPIKISTIENYEREIPDEIAEMIAKTRDIFDAFYIVYTDYTGKTERRAEAIKKEKDPILFGAFIDRNKRVCVDRFYYLGDWIDPYCDLTLDKMVAYFKESNKQSPAKSIHMPKTLDELRIVRDNARLKDGVIFQSSTSDNAFMHYKKETSYFQKVRTFLSKLFVK